MNISSGIKDPDKIRNDVKKMKRSSKKEYQKESNK